MLPKFLDWGFLKRVNGKRRMENIMWEFIRGRSCITDSTKETAFYSIINIKYGGSDWGKLTKLFFKKINGLFKETEL